MYQPRTTNTQVEVFYLREIETAHMTAEQREIYLGMKATRLIGKKGQPHLPKSEQSLESLSDAELYHALRDFH